MMKFITFVFMIGFSAAHAQGVADGGGMQVPVLLVAEHFPSPFNSEPEMVRIEVLENGIAFRMVTDFNDNILRMEDLAQLDQKTLSKVTRCSAELAKAEFTPSVPRCTDSNIVSYKSIYGEKEFATHFCGHTETVSSKCARDMVKLLDELSKLPATTLGDGPFHP